MERGERGGDKQTRYALERTHAGLFVCCSPVSIKYGSSSGSSISSSKRW